MRINANNKLLYGFLSISQEEQGSGNSQLHQSRPSGNPLDDQSCSSLLYAKKIWA